MESSQGPLQGSLPGPFLRPFFLSHTSLLGLLQFSLLRVNIISNSKYQASQPSAVALEPSGITPGKLIPILCQMHMPKIGPTKRSRSTRILILVFCWPKNNLAQSFLDLKFFGSSIWHKKKFRPNFFEVSFLLVQALWRPNMFWKVFSLEQKSVLWPQFFCAYVAISGPTSWFFFIFTFCFLTRLPNS